MTTPDDAPFLVSDDALASMLRERAGRTPATAGTAVMARVHAEIAKPRANNLFAFLPIGERAGSMSGLAGWALAIAAAVIVMAVLGGRQPDGPAATPGSSAAPGMTLATLPPLGSPEPGAGDGRPLSGLALKDALADGSLEGRLIVMDGVLAGFDLGCTASPCASLSFVGLEGVSLVWNGPIPPVDPASSAGRPFPGANDWRTGRFLARQAGEGLDLLGRLVGDLSDPVSVKTALNDPRGYPNASSPFDVLAVRGVLTSDCEDAGSCAVEGPYMADPDSGRFGGLGGNGAVSVADDAFGLPREPRIEGPFLLRFEPVPEACPRLALCTAPGWGANPTLVGRYDAGQIVEVVLP